MRIVTIFLALLAGLASLLVSVCGGGFVLSMGYAAIRAMLHPRGTQTTGSVLPSALPILMFAVASAAVGGWAFWRCIQFIRREWRDRN